MKNLNLGTTMPTTNTNLEESNVTDNLEQDDDVQKFLFHNFI